jgi:hypothetical protein
MSAQDLADLLTFVRSIDDQTPPFASLADTFIQ